VRTGAIVDELLLLPEQRRRLPRAESSRKCFGLLMLLLVSAVIQGTLQGRCTKADFITYYKDASTRRTVKRVFYTGNPHLAAANSAICFKLCSSFSLMSIRWFLFQS
jgi:hypothetical protein